MRAIRIDVEKRTVTEVELDSTDTLKALQEQVGGLITTAHCLENGDDIYCDDEGLLKPQEGFFCYDLQTAPFPGNGIIVGADDKGRTVAAKSTVEEIQKAVVFMNSIEAYTYAKKEGW